jgi:hypothetical protein
MLQHLPGKPMKAASAYLKEYTQVQPIGQGRWAFYFGLVAFHWRIRRKVIGVTHAVTLPFYSNVFQKFDNGCEQDSVSVPNRRSGLPKRPGYAIVWTCHGSLAQR